MRQFIHSECYWPLFLLSPTRFQMKIYQTQQNFQFQNIQQLRKLKEMREFCINFHFVLRNCIWFMLKPMFFWLQKRTKDPQHIVSIVIIPNVLYLMKLYIFSLSGKKEIWNIQFENFIEHKKGILIHKLSLEKSVILSG